MFEVICMHGMLACCMIMSFVVFLKGSHYCRLLTHVNSGFQSISMMKDKVKAKYVALLNEAMEKYRNVEILVRHQEENNVDTQIISRPTVGSNEAVVKLRKLPQIEETVNANVKNRVMNKNKKQLMRKDKKLVVLKHFSPQEDKIIFKALKNDENINKICCVLSKKLGRRYNAIQNRIWKLQQTGSSRRSYKHFTFEEDCKVLESAIESLKSSKSLSETKLHQIEDLALNLNRQVKSVENRWNNKLRTMLLQYYNKTLNLELRPMLVNFLADNFASLDEIEWKRVLDLPEFVGHTIASVKIIFHSTIIDRLSTYLGIKRTEVTLQQLAEAAKTYPHFKQLSDKSKEKQNKIIEYFEKLVATHDVRNFL